jgi:hypothetical protein
MIINCFSSLEHDNKSHLQIFCTGCEFKSNQHIEPDSELKRIHPKEVKPVSFALRKALMEQEEA